MSGTSVWSFRELHYVDFQDTSLRMDVPGEKRKYKNRKFLKDFLSNDKT